MKWASAIPVCLFNRGITKPAQISYLEVTPELRTGVNNKVQWERNVFVEKTTTEAFT
jgi:hypothetical protein